MHCKDCRWSKDYINEKMRMCINPKLTEFIGCVLLDFGCVHFEEKPKLLAVKVTCNPELEDIRDKISSLLSAYGFKFSFNVKEGSDQSYVYTKEREII